MLLFGRTQMLPQFSYEEAAAFLMKAGFDGIEISAFDKQFHPRDAFFAPDFPEKMKESLKRFGAKGFSVSAHMDYTQSPQAYQIVRDTLGVAAALGSELLIINGAIRRAEEEYEAQWEAMIQKTKELAHIAGELGLRLAVEYEPGFVIDNTDDLLRAFREIDSPVMGINCDIGHYFLCEKEPLEAIRRSGPYIIHCHIENMAAGVHDHLVPWEGDMDLSAYIKTLREIGFSGGMGLDLYKYEYADVCEKSAAYLKDLLK